MEATTWYSMSGDLDVCERGPIALDSALRVVDDYFAKLKPHYESGEDAVAETTFGFARGSDDFIEICLHTPSKISINVELPRASGGFLAMLRARFHHTRTLESRDALKRLVTAYFNSTAEKFEAHLRGDR